MPPRLSPSVARGLPVRQKLSEGRKLLAQYRAAAREGHDFSSLFAEVEEYDELLGRYAGIPIGQARVFEIGFGARPHRQLILQSMGVDVRGVDAEVPALTGSPREYVESFRRNGPERALKSLVRHTLFDRRERLSLERALRDRGLEPRLAADRLQVGDAGDVELADGSLDLIFSEDVFEHVEPQTLERLLDRMRRWLRPGGLALVRPNVFPGIVGGHLLEWSRAAMRHPPAQRASEPWEHLRRRRFTPNTYLNELARAEYRRLFSARFELLEERVAQADLGRGYFDDAARRELSDWPEDELFSNQVLFVLRVPAE